MMVVLDVSVCVCLCVCVALCKCLCQCHLCVRLSVCVAVGCRYLWFWFTHPCCHGWRTHPQLPPSQVTLKRRFADAVPRAAAALDAAVEAIHTEEGLLRAYTIGIRDLGAIEQQLEGMLRLFEANEPLKSNSHVNEAVEAGVEAVLTASGMRDEMSRPADPDAEIAMHGHAPGAPSGDSSPATNILAVLHAMPAPEALQAWMVAIQETGPLVTRAYQVVMQQLRGKDVVVRTMVTERRKAEVLLQRTEDQLNQCKGRVEYVGA